MPRTIVFSALFLVCSVHLLGSRPHDRGRQSLLASPSQSPRTGGDVSPRRELLAKYCVTCHNERLKTAKLMLDKANVEDIGADAEVWEKVVRKLRSGAMPPPGLPRPDPARVHQFVSSLETALDGAAVAAPTPGRTAIHRLNRVEYGNAIRDLLDLETDTRSLLPADDEAYGFDNIADVLSVSPTLLERYQSAARRISQLAVGDPATRPVFETYTIPERLVQDGQVSDDLPFGSRGGIAVRYFFPLDGEYVLRIRLRRTIYSYIRGLGFPHLLDIRVDGERVTVFTVGGEHDATGLRPPETNSGHFIGDAQWEDYSHRADERLEVRFAAKAGTRVVGASFDKTLAQSDGILDAPLNMSTFGYASDEMQHGNPAIATLMIGGPYSASGPGDTSSRRKIFSCRPTGATVKDEERCARQILTGLVRRAYRRPVTDEDIHTLMSFWAAGRSMQSERGFDAGIQFALERMITDPEFLFRIERDPAGVAPASAYRLADLELASRLSFFLWSSIPDDELLEVAAHGRLKNPNVLEQQVRRLVADVRSKALPDNFGGQWLGLRNLRVLNPDYAIFPEFDENLREAMQQETQLFLESQVREDRGLLSLLTANFTFLNETLARHYGIPGVYGSHFRRVTIADDRRKGLLGQASLMTVTSYPNRTSPVLRGQWLLGTFLGAPPPEPPPNVPALPERGHDGKPLSVRQRLEEHRKDPVCASCHRTIDPMGFALENFDAIGKFRTVNEGRTRSEVGEPIDSKGVLPDGTAFNGVSELRAVLVNSRKEEFVTAVVEKLLTYALGRGLEYYDMPAVRRIVREASASDYSWSSVIMGIVKSAPFQMKRAAS